jgi:hypothetical protein
MSTTQPCQTVADHQYADVLNLDYDSIDMLVRQMKRPLDVIFQDPATIAFWPDGTKTVARCSTDDIYDPETGLMVCIAKHYFGSGTELHRVLAAFLTSEDDS